MRYLLTDAAVGDIREIVHHIRVIQKSPQNAKLVANRLKKAFQQLARFPGLGHIREELQDANTRVLAISGVLVIYDPTLSPLVILRVIHAARELEGITVRRS